MERERGKLRRELDQARLLLAAAEGRLANPDFVARAPEAIVEGARRRALELAEQVALLVRRLEE